VESACRSSRIARCLSARRDAYRYPDIARAERRVKPKLGCRSVRDFPFHRIRTFDRSPITRDRRRFSLLLALLHVTRNVRREGSGSTLRGSERGSFPASSRPNDPAAPRVYCRRDYSFIRQDRNDEARGRRHYGEREARGGEEGHSQLNTA